jgi:putative phosphoesterase
VDPASASNISALWSGCANLVQMAYGTTAAPMEARPPDNDARNGPAGGLYNRPMTFRIGIISDTHGLLRPEAERRLAGVDHIIHGGDIGRPEIIDALRRIAPVTAIRGNVDIDDWAVAYPETEVVRLAGKAIYVLNDLKTLRIDPIARGIDVVVSGHSLPKIETADGVLYLNPGSAGRRRFGLHPATGCSRAASPRAAAADLGGSCWGRRACRSGFRPYCCRCLR